MKSHSDINLIRHYCNIKHIEIFDASYHYQKEFSHLSESVFRKYMSRLVEEGFLQYVAKGIYYVGWKMPEDIDKKIELYFSTSTQPAFQKTVREFMEIATILMSLL